MKKHFYNKLKAYMRCELLKTRERLNINQEEMAHRLLISSRAYASLEGGKSCCSLLTVVLFISRCCIDRQYFLDGLISVLELSENEEY